MTQYSGINQYRYQYPYQENNGAQFPTVDGTSFPTAVGTTFPSAVGRQFPAAVGPHLAVVGSQYPVTVGPHYPATVGPQYLATVGPQCPANVDPQCPANVGPQCPANVGVGPQCTFPTQDNIGIGAPYVEHSSAGEAVAVGTTSKVANEPSSTIFEEDEDMHNTMVNYSTQMFMNNPDDSEEDVA